MKVKALLILLVIAVTVNATIQQMIVAILIADNLQIVAVTVNKQNAMIAHQSHHASALLMIHARTAHQ